VMSETAWGATYFGSSGHRSRRAKPPQDATIRDK
jgi:hypothetical protein